LLKAADASVSATLKGQLDFDRRTITIGKAKTPAGTGRIIPMNDELVAVMASHAERFTETFGDTRADHCVFPFGSPVPNDPTRQRSKSRPHRTRSAWRRLKCRWHDLRHTACSDVNKAGVSEAMRLAIFGWSSRKMIERYSHIRTEVRREAMNSLTLKAPVKPEEQSNLNVVPKESPEETTPTRIM